VTSLIRSVALEEGRHGIRANAVGPGRGLVWAEAVAVARILRRVGVNFAEVFTNCLVSAHLVRISEVGKVD
jgi:NAD(P)-dependent dehydrogenase (short-subunit alcohol dehydrogenase family)